MIIIRPCVFHVIMRKELINMENEIMYNGETYNNMLFRNVVTADPTLKMIFEKPIEFDKFDWHVTVKFAALMIAMDRFIKLL